MNTDTGALELQMILEHSRDHVVIADGKGRVLQVSASCASVYGVAIPDLIGASVFDLELERIFSPSITVQVLRTRRQSQLMQRTLTGRTVMAEAYPIWDGDQLVRVISFSKDMTDIRMLQREYELLHRQLAAQEAARTTADIEIAGLTARSAPMREVASLIKRVAPTDASVLLLGETGVGKTMIASMLHHLGARRSGPIVEANCGAIPETLFESEMFGYVAGAFSGAARGGKPGLAERADGGTLFLDEIAELPLAVQAKLLRVIQDGQVTRLGSTEPRTIDFRLVSATNRNLEERVAEGHFRLDLYHRLNVVPVTIPPLRERREDIPGFVKQMLEALNARYGTDKALAPECWAYLMNHEWAGNVRELQNVMERLYVISEGSLIHLDSLTANASRPAEAQVSAPEAERQTLRQAVETAEKDALMQAIEHCTSTYDVAEYLGASQPTVFRKLRKYGLRLEKSPSTGE